MLKTFKRASSKRSAPIVWIVFCVLSYLQVKKNESSKKIPRIFSLTFVSHNSEQNRKRQSFAWIKRLTNFDSNFEKLTTMTTPVMIRVMVAMISNITPPLLNVCGKPSAIIWLLTGISCAGLVCACVQFGCLSAPKSLPSKMSKIYDNYSSLLSSSSFKLESIICYDVWQAWQWRH